MNNKKAKKIRKMLRLKNADTTKVEKQETRKRMYINKLDGSKQLIEVVRTTITNPIKNAYRKIKKSNK